MKITIRSRTNAREKEKESMSRNFGHGVIDFNSKCQI
jgi:hypothetical protein